MLKRFLVTLIVLCVLAAGGWYAYGKFFAKPYTKSTISAAMI